MGFELLYAKHGFQIPRTFCMMTPNDPLIFFDFYPVPSVCSNPDFIKVRKPFVCLHGGFLSKWYRVYYQFTTHSF